MFSRSSESGSVCEKRFVPACSGRKDEHGGNGGELYLAVELWNIFDDRFKLSQAFVITSVL